MQGYARWARILPLGIMFIFSAAQAAPNQQTIDTATYFHKIRGDKTKLLLFLSRMPKGGDLHNHFAGAIYAETLLRDAKNDNICINEKTFATTENTSCQPADKLNHITINSKLYNSLVDAWSLHDFHGTPQAEHNHFFDTFDKYFPLVLMHSGQVLAQVISNAAYQNEIYLELMITPDKNASGALGDKIGWNNNLNLLREKLLAGGLRPIIHAARQQVNSDEVSMHSILHCNTVQAEKGCQVTVRYLYQAFREQPPAEVFAQLLTGFELANQDPRFVGINLVEAEDGHIALRDYRLHMQMIKFLHQLYPKVNISLHAGELTPQLVPLTDLRFHIRGAIETAHAERIGQGVSIRYEENAAQLFDEMEKKHIAVEINLSSNAAILGIQGKKHPFLIYLNHNVPITLSTDDAGVLRTDLTHEYFRAATTYNLDYFTLKNIARNSLTYSFLPGVSLWQDANKLTPVEACKEDTLGSSVPSPLCQSFLASSEKARLQWKLEQEFLIFEKEISQHALARPSLSSRK